jgi:hypothetical protein
MRGSFETTNANRLLLRPRGVITVITDVETLCGAIAISFSGEAASKTAWVFPNRTCGSTLQILAADFHMRAFRTASGQEPDDFWRSGLCRAARRENKQIRAKAASLEIPFRRLPLCSKFPPTLRLQRSGYVKGTRSSVMSVTTATVASRPGRPYISEHTQK